MICDKKSVSYKIQSVSNLSKAFKIFNLIPDNISKSDIFV